jgi:hypothetical protein
MNPTKLMLKTSNEMNTQNNRCAEYPLFVIQEDMEEWCNEGIADRCKRTEETDVDLLCEECSKIWDEDGELPENCENCEHDAFDWYRIVDHIDLNAGVFLTAKACQEHIDCNSYHYENPRVYGIGCWRNPEMEEVIKFMRGLTNDKSNK